MSGVLGALGGNALSVLGEYLECSFRGVPFAILGSGGTAGRKFAVHDYPFRDNPKAEDIGRRGRGFRVRGFVCGLLYQVQFDAVLAAVEQPGPGLLIHPTRGVVNAAVLDFQWREPDGRSGVIELEFEFLEQKSLLSTTILAAAQAVIAVGSALLTSGASSDYQASTATGYALGSPVAGAATAVCAAWAAQAAALSLSPTVTAAALAGLPTYYGRFVSGNAVVSEPDATVDTALADLVTGQGAVSAAVAAVSSAIGPVALATATQGVSEALRGLVADPAAQIALLSQLAGFAPAVVPSSAVIGGAIAAAQAAAASLCRRSALASVALACSNYAPSSYDDAEALRTGIAALLGAEILVAADAGDDGSFGALRSLRAVVLKDLADRASQLAQLITVTRNLPIPAPLMAQQLYADGSRCADLILRADPVHPAFMPTTCRVLAT